MGTVLEGDCAGWITGGTTVMIGVHIGNAVMPELKQGDRLVLVIPSNSELQTPNSDSRPQP